MCFSDRSHGAALSKGAGWSVRSLAEWQVISHLAGVNRAEGWELWSGHPQEFVGEAGPSPLLQGVGGQKCHSSLSFERGAGKI